MLETFAYSIKVKNSNLRTLYYLLSKRKSIYQVSIDNNDDEFSYVYIESKMDINEMKNWLYRLHQTGGVKYFGVTQVNFK